MTAPLLSHRTREVWLGGNLPLTREQLIARVCDADAQRGAVYEVPGQLWDRLAEGNMIWDRTSPRVHIRAALQRTARMHVRGKGTPNE